MTQTYTVQLSHGLGMINETLSYLDLWQEGMNATDLYRAALESGQFPGVSARSLRDSIAVGFAPRYLVNDAAPALLLKTAKERLATREVEQLFFLFTCRAHRILRDFLLEVYWPAYVAGKESISESRCAYVCGTGRA